MMLLSAGALGVLLVGQQTGSELLDAALGQDVDTMTLMKEVESFVGLGVSATDAAIIVATVVFAARLLKSLDPFLRTSNDWLRRRLRLDPEPPAPL